MYYVIYKSPSTGHLSTCTPVIPPECPMRTSILLKVFMSQTARIASSDPVMRISRLKSTAATMSSLALINNVWEKNGRKGDNLLKGSGANPIKFRILRDHS